MKKQLLFCFSLLLLWSCSLDDNDTNFHFEFLPVESATLPDEFVLGNTYTIDYSYYRPSTCHGFHDLSYGISENQRTITVINIVYEENNCEPLTDELVERTFDFKVLYDQTYVFKFWQGEDEDGNDLFLTYEVPVVH